MLAIILSLPFMALKKFESNLSQLAAITPSYSLHVFAKFSLELVHLLDLKLHQNFSFNCFSAMSEIFLVTKIFGFILM